MDENVVYQVQGLIRNNAKRSIVSLNKGVIPSKIDISLHREYSYEEHGLLYSMYKDDSMLFCAVGLPYTHNQKRHSFEDSLLNVINNGEIHPFMLFLDGKFIKWSNIIVIKDHAYSYILVKNFIKDNCDYKVVLLPDYSFEYKEENKSYNNEIFAFNPDGYFTRNAKSYGYVTTINIKDSNIYKETGVKNVNTKILMNLDADHKIQSENLFIFNSVGEYDYKDKLYLNGLNVFTVKTSNSAQRRKLYYVAFYNNKSAKSVDNIMGVSNRDYVTSYMVDTNGSDKYMQLLNEEFDFEFEPTYSFERNMNDALKYIMHYNPILMSDLYKRKSNIVIKTYTGLELSRLKAANGYITMSRRIDETIDNYVMIFKNGLIYDHYHEISYINKNFTFPFIGIDDNDIIEIMYLKNMNNKSYDIVFDYNNESDIMSIYSEINMDDMKLFTMTPKSKEFNIEANENIQYEIPFHCEDLGNDNYNIYPEDVYYYNKRLSLASKRQFRYTYKIMKDSSISFKLSDYFRFCNDFDKYMVFVNGRKISNSYYKITIPKDTRPFDNISVYLATALSVGDIIEVFYIGEDLSEIYASDTLDLNGNIALDKSKLKFGFDKDLYMVFVNGRKVLPSNIVDVDANRLEIVNATDSIKNVSIIKYVSDEAILTDLFLGNEDRLSQIYSKIPADIMDKLFKKEDMNDIEEDINKGSIPIKDVLQKIIRDYWARPLINNGESLLYDYDVDGLDTDSDGTIIATALTGDSNTVK